VETLILPRGRRSTQSRECGDWSSCSVNLELTGTTVWLAQQWSPGLHLALLDKPAVALNMAILN